MLSKLRLMRFASTARTSAPISVSVASSFSALLVEAAGEAATSRNVFDTFSRFCASVSVKPSMFSTLRATRCGSTARTSFCTSSVSDSSFAASGPMRSAACPTCSRTWPRRGRSAQRDTRSLGVPDRAADADLRCRDTTRPTRSSTSSARRAMLRALSSRSWKSERSAKIVGSGLPGPGWQRRGAGIAADERDGGDAGQALQFEPGAGVGADRRRAVDLDDRRRPGAGPRAGGELVTSPTRRPLKVTTEPCDRPETEPAKTTRTGCRRCAGVAAREPVDEAEAAAITASVKTPMRA